MDEADIAAELIAENERLAILTKRPVGIRPVGSCYFCEEEVSFGRLFCDEHCTQDWDRIQRAQRLRGAYPANV